MKLHISFSVSQHLFFRQITTFASCGGHENGNDFPYIGIIVNDKSIPYIKSILGQLQKMQNSIISCLDYADI